MTTTTEKTKFEMMVKAILDTIIQSAYYFAIIATIIIFGLIILKIFEKIIT